MATKTLISKSNKISTVNGPGHNTTINQYVFHTDKPYFSVGKGSMTSKSITKHMTEPAAIAYLKTLP